MSEMSMAVVAMRSWDGQLQAIVVLCLDDSLEVELPRIGIVEVLLVSVVRRLTVLESGRLWEYVSHLHVGG